MKLTIDTEQNRLAVAEKAGERELPLYSKEAFELLSRLWVKVGWNEKYPYTFSWLGRPIIQLPEDMIRLQEVIYRTKPTVIVETGIAHGGSLVYSASLLNAMGVANGRVIGIDIEIRPHNRAAIEAHELFDAITLIEGDSVAPENVDKVRERVNEDDRVLVVLDSNHTLEHVAAELEAYHSLVTVGSYIVATDGVMQDVFDVPRGKPEWKDNHPSAAAIQFAAAHPEFEIEQPAWPFNESELSQNVTHWPSAWLRRVR